MRCQKITRDHLFDLLSGPEERDFPRSVQNYARDMRACGITFETSGRVICVTSTISFLFQRSAQRKAQNAMSCLITFNTSRHECFASPPRSPIRSIRSKIPQHCVFVASLPRATQHLSFTCKLCVSSNSEKCSLDANTRREPHNAMFHDRHWPFVVSSSAERFKNKHGPTVPMRKACLLCTREHD